MKKNFLFYISILYLTLFCQLAFAQIANNDFPFSISYYKDGTNKQTFSQITKENFTNKTNLTILNFGISNATFWVKLSSKELFIAKNKLIILDQSRFSISEIYLKDKNQFKSFKPINLFEDTKYKNYHGNAFNLPDTLKPHDVIYLRLKAQEAFISKISIIKKDSLVERYSTKDIIFGIYSGIMIVMFFYNLFLFIAVRDQSYIYYIFYILFTWLSQIAIQGYKVKFIWELSAGMDYASVMIFSSFGLISACLFTITFLNTKVFVPKLHLFIKVYTLIIFINLLSCFLIEKHLSFIILQVLILIGTVIALSTSYYIYYKKNFKPAGYYLIAWSVLLLGVTFFILKDYGIIPYNNFTVYLMQMASGVEVILLSFALADRINFFKKENELAQAQVLNASLENQRLIKEQNIILEQKVKERTEELENANTSLNDALDNLKAAQSQLVDSEKMVALGQLTAGIAHEINNPINFVTSNIKPLQLDFIDLQSLIKKYEEIDLTKDISSQLAEIEQFKAEIDINYLNNEIGSLLDGINEGAKRTAEIIRSLRNFSRLDESDMKPVDLNEGLDSTLVLVRNNIPHFLTVHKELGNLPKVECLPGKINQVFMNLITNAIQAVKSKPNLAEEEFLTVKSWYENQEVKVSIKDSGTGMTDETKQRIFEPFFTTKDIGEGTGLGLSIVFSIIEAHKGKIEVNSQIGDGTEFLITLPVSKN